MMRRILIATVFAAAAVAVVLWLIPAEERKATQTIDYVERFRTLKPQAEKGSAEAQYALARLYEKGRGVTRSPREAFMWYRRAAEQGFPKAQFALGRLYDKGEVVRADSLKAIRWYELAYRQSGMREAAFAIGLLFYHGRGVLKDYTEAVTWFRRAAEKGHPCAQFLMGGIYEEGWAVKRDPVEAYKWYTVAIPGRERCLAMNRTYDAVAARERLAKRLSDFQIKKGKERAAAWQPRR